MSKRVGGISKVKVSKSVLGNRLEHIRFHSHLPLTQLMGDGLENVMAQMKCR